MKRILGLDLGTNSIGWALVEVDEDGKIVNILGMGSRIIPLSPDDANEFTSGKSITKNRKRTEQRTTRKCFDRYQLRRLLLTIELRKFNMLPDEHLIKLPVLDLWQLRAKAATKGNKLSLPELGRVLYHLNQKRGYKHAKSDESNDKNQREYVANVNARHANIKQLGKTIGQYFAEKLEENQVITEKGKFYTYRIKDQVFPRRAYEEEFDQIMECQKEFYPEILTDEFIDKVRNEIIYYQRKLKSCKHLVSLCEFEKRAYLNKDGKVVYDGPKVAPRTSPLFQVCKIWESVNNLKIKNRKNDELYITQEQRIAMFNFLNNNERMTLTDMYKILKIDKSDGWWGGKAIGKGLQGNTTKMQLKKALSNYQNADELLQFNLDVVDSDKIDEETGEVLKVVSPKYEHEPLYKLWHTIYSIQDKDELKNALQKNWGITDEMTLNSLFALDFIRPGYGNKSSKFIRKILPYLQDGMMYNEACAYIGVNHSNSLTKAENETRKLLEKLPQIKKNELRQPVVEKILNQMINVVNAIFDKYGKDDDTEIRVELARELKQSREERELTDKNNRKRQKENDFNAKLIEEYGIRASRNRIQKYRMWKESKETCFYCGQVVDVKDFLRGYDVEVEHIIPKALFFDDSFSNKVCSCRKCNSEKRERTAYDYMSSKGGEEFNRYIRTVEERYKKGEISKTKRERLLTPADKIPADFINRQLRETQYIAKKSVEILKQVCRNVWITSGSVTDFLRHNWGYDEILHTLDFDRYKSGGLTEIIEIEHKGQKHKKERIKDWSKRLDHRHHAVDALVIACTKQSYIQRLNNLNTERDAMFQDVEAQSVEWKEKHSLLEKWIKLQPHPTVSEVTDKVAGILVSYKAGKRVATLGKRAIYKKGKKIIAQNGIVVPRGALCEDSIYGQIDLIEKNKPVKYLFENPSLIFKPYIKTLVEERLKEYNGDVSKAISSLKNDPIYLRKDKSVVLEYGTCYKKEYVKKYSIDSIKAKDVDSIIDKHIREIVRQRLLDHNNNEKVAFVEQLYADEQKQIPIKSVRRTTGINIATPVNYNENNEPISFVKPGNNHHVAIYLDKDGKRHEHIVTFWHAVERKKYGIPVVITNPKEVWDFIIEKDLDLPESFLNCLPNSEWNYEISMQQNEMFIMGMSEDEFQDAIRNNDYKTLNKYLYRVQRISESDYWFRYHVETILDETPAARNMKKYIRIKSLGSFVNNNPHKVKITLLGEIQPS